MRRAVTYVHPILPGAPVEADVLSPPHFAVITLVYPRPIHTIQRPVIWPEAGSTNGLATRSQSASGAGIGFGVGIASPIPKVFPRVGVPFAPLTSSGEAPFFRMTVVLPVKVGAAASVPLKTGKRSLFRSRFTACER